MTNKTFTIRFYEDPGHGWGKVRREVLQSLGIADSISCYSYQRGEYAYLEEDCDLSLLCQRLNEHGTVIKWVYKRSNNTSRIRSYERYQSTNAEQSHEPLVESNLVNT